MDFLHPIADREPLEWIVREQRTAFTARRGREAERLAAGDQVFLYATRGCFHNPTRDRGRVIGLAVVARPTRKLRTPARFGDREYPLGVSLQIQLLARRREGVELATLVPQLATFPNKVAWSAWLRRTLLPLADGDGKLLADLLAEVALPYPHALPTYATSE